ncbi:MAG: hypothetical protein MR400_02975 [Clostridiales bacterium]|nr:hypothetical protein [Clostridiales bacterium]
MADKITVSPQELSACAMAYVRASMKLTQATATYSRALQSLASDWTGKAFAIMCLKVAQMVKNLAQSYYRCLDAVTELLKVKGMFEQNEKELTGAFNALETGSSPFDN